MMRSLIYILTPILFFASCNPNQEKFNSQIVTVTGPISESQMGLTLEHEHVLVDFIGAEKVKQPQYPIEQALDSLLPYFIRLKESGVQSLIECTPQYIGRDVLLLKAISEKSGLYILTNTGYYAAADKKYLPAHTYCETADQLAERWISEWKNGIDGTGIKPGFIKLGVGGNRLDTIEQKIVTAGAITHLATGLKIAIHTGGALPANDEIDILKTEGVDPSALIVVHSQNMPSEEQIKILKRGAWVSLDGVNNHEGSIEKYTNFLKAIKNENLLYKTLISQDAYWSVIQKENNEIGFEKHGSQYSAILVDLATNLKSNGFSQVEIDQLLINNPAEAYTIEVCKLDQ